MPVLRAFILAALGLISAAVLMSAPAAAQQPPEPVEETARAFLAEQAHGLPGEVEIVVGQFDTSNQLPECAALHATLPSGMQAWGRVSVAVRCQSPVTWTVYLPAEVQVHTHYLVSAQAIRPGQIIGPGDLVTEYGNLAAQPSDTLTDMSQAVGAHARQAVGEGRPLRRSMLRLPPTVQQGDNVKVVGSGTGFSISSEGRALNRAAEGERVRVRLDNGEVVTGTAQPDGSVQIRF